MSRYGLSPVDRDFGWMGDGHSIWKVRYIKEDEWKMNYLWCVWRWVVAKGIQGWMGVTYCRMVARSNRREGASGVGCAGRMWRVVRVKEVVTTAWKEGGEREKSRNWWISDIVVNCQLVREEEETKTKTKRKKERKKGVSDFTVW